MITRIYVDNFKSLVDFEMKLSNFNCLVGLNGAGKSTVLQAIDFISQLMIGDVDEWLKKRQWEAADLNSKLSKKQNISFKLHLHVESHGEIIWSGSLNRSTLKCTQEQITCEGKVYLKVEDGQYFVVAKNGGGERATIVFDYQGSILSQFKENLISEVVDHLKSSIRDTLSLDLISPELLRSRAKSSDGKLGLGGERLSAFLHESGDFEKERLKTELHHIYNQLDKIETKSLRAGWKQLEITENFNNHKIKSTARHMNDGMLRMMAILSQLTSQTEFLLFDEIENGINPELVEYLVDHLVKSNHQVLVTTHSPVILNFLEDSIAREGVIYLYKNKDGITKNIHLFEIPSLARKLDFMGPGEAFIDTDLIGLYEEIANIDELSN
jgi:predicted ATPase